MRYLKNKTQSKETISILLKLLAPFAPHICEELWHYIGNTDTIAYEKWPIFDEKHLIKENYCHSNSNKWKDER